MSNSPQPGLPTSARPARKKRNKGGLPSSSVDFQFLNISHPAEAKNEESRRAVRSHVTKKQHQREQLATAAAVGRSKSAPIATVASTFKRPPNLRTPHSIASSVPYVGRDGLMDQSPPAARTDAVLSNASETTSLESNVARPQPGLDTTDVVSLISPHLYPRKWQPSILDCLSHYLSLLGMDTADLQIENPLLTIRNIWLPFVLSSDTLTHATLLFAAAYTNPCLESGQQLIDLDYLRTQAIKGVNVLLQDESKRLSDITVASAMHMAAFEALFGDVNAYEMHMSGLQKLVELRGGLRELGVDGLLERLLLLFDANSARATGKPMFFEVPDSGRRDSLLVHSLTRRVSSRGNH